ncbi:hypothetical protein J7I44_07895 [Frateuria sp. MAH-13]|uniref:Uncharacterized protein n=1 Tax=Frateuria flava TaxID=2821489 RepID=A0ABS4DMC8_9GAMM|nr:hypothetical protein [Frateuria flava]MBP1474217.1 hypothetical protein [Frateuria flava]
MSRSLRYAVLIPLSILAFYVLFVLPDVDLGWPGGLALIGGAWLVWYLLWATWTASGTSLGEAVAAVSPGEQRAWIGLLFTLAILLYFGLRASQMVGTDGGRAPEATAIGRHIGMMVVAWLVVMQVLARRWRDKVQADERDRAIEARAAGWARGSLVVLVVALAVLFAFTPPDRLAWARPMTLSNMLMAGLIGSCLLEYLVTGLAYWRDRR